MMNFKREAEAAEKARAEAKEAADKNHKELLAAMVAAEKHRGEKRHVEWKNTEIAKMTPLWTDCTDPEAYLNTFEEEMSRTTLDRESWVKELRPKLTRRALSVFREFSANPGEDFRVMREQFLRRMGASLD